MPPAPVSSICGRSTARPALSSSVIVSPLGEVLAGPIYGREELLVATVDLDDVVRGRYELDVTGHYARPDVFTLSVDDGGQNRD